MKTFSKETLIKAYTYLNNVYQNLEVHNDIYGAWEGLVEHMGVSGDVARNLLAMWIGANNF